MLKSRAIRKIFITSLSLFIFLFVSTFFQFNSSENTLRTNLEIASPTGLSTDTIYLLNERNLLVKSKVLLDEVELEDKVYDILEQLTVKKNDYLPEGLSVYIPKNTEVLSVIIADGIVTIDFSKEFLNMKVYLEKQIISGIVYSVLELDSNLGGVVILVEGEVLEEYPNTHEKINSPITKDIGINEEYNLTSREDISKVVVYYLSRVQDEIYYVPVTKYVNDSRDKIKIIVDELASSVIYEDNLMSFLHSNIKLIDYYEEGGVMFLNFNDYLFDSDDKVLEEVLYSISYSVFDNYDVSQVMFEVNNQYVGQVFQDGSIKIQ